MNSRVLGSSGYEARPTDPTRRGLFDLRRRLSELARGHFSLLYTGTGDGSEQWTDLRVPLSTAATGGAKAPTYQKWRDNGSGSQGVYGYSFSATVEEEVFFEAQLPHSYKQGSRLAPHLHYVLPGVPAAGQTLRFGLEYTYANVDGLFPTTTIIYALETFTGSEAANTQYIAGFDPDIEDADMRVSAMFSCRLFRDVATDTYTGKPVVIEFDFHYQIDSLGSDQEFTK